MFSKRLTQSAKFLKMPISCQALYFHLGIHADDDGVVEAYNVIRATGCTEDDLRVLVTKGYVRVLNDDLVTYINDWRENNSIRADRKIDSIYKNLLIAMIPDVKLVESRQRADVKPKIIDTTSSSVDDETGTMDNQWTTNGQPMDGIGEDRIDKFSLGKVSLEKESHLTFQTVLDLYHQICVSYPKLRKPSTARQKRINDRIKNFSFDDFKLLFEKAEASDFMKGINDKGWSANFDWMMNENNMLKVLEGNYDNRSSGNNKPSNQFNNFSQREGTDYDALLNKMCGGAG